MNPRSEILQAIATLTPPTHAVAISIHIKGSLKQNWFTRRWPILNEFRSLSLGTLWVHLHRLEADGLLTSEWSAESFPELGGLRRRYYRLTAAGREQVRKSCGS